MFSAEARVANRTRPNPRLQRTPSASPPSPLSRQPLGRLQQFAGLIPVFIGCVSLLGCESFKGRLYEIGKAPRFAVESHCEAIQSGTGSFVRVDARDWQDAVLPGVSIRLSGSVNGRTLHYETDAHGLVNAWVDPGEWRVDAALRGFSSAWVNLQVPADQACTVKLQLRLSDMQEFSVASRKVGDHE